MRVLALSAVLAMVIAGCAQPTPAQTDEGEPTPGTPVVRLPDDLVAPTLGGLKSLGGGPGEPNIAAGPNGELYVASTNTFYASLDNGTTWAAGARPDGGGDGDIDVDDTGRIHWAGLFGDAGPIPYQYSDDGGQTWSDAIDLSEDQGNDREWLAARPDGTVYVTWRDDRDGGVMGIRVSHDGGEHWDNFTTIAPDAIPGPIAYGPDGEVFMAYATLSDIGASDAELRFARSTDDGATWETFSILEPSQSAQVGLIGFPFSIFPVVDMDDNGTMYVVIGVDQQMAPASLPKSASRFGIYMLTSSDHGKTWGDARLLSDPDHAAIMPWVDAGAPGRVVVTWYENTVGVPHDNLPDLWNVYMMEALDADSDAMQTQVVQLNSDPVQIGTICTSGTGCLAGGDRAVLDFFEVTIMPNGQPAAAWAHKAQPYVGSVTIEARIVEDGTPLALPVATTR